MIISEGGKGSRWEGDVREGEREGKRGREG